MLRRRLSQLVALTLGFAGLVAGSDAKAAFFEYTTTVSITSDSSTPAGTVTNNGGASSVDALNGNSITLTALNSAAGVPHIATTSDIVPLGLAVVASGTASTLDFNFTLTVNIKDFASASSTVSDGNGNATFSGRIAGTIGGNSAVLDLLSFVPSSNIVSAGPSIYTVSYNGFTSPGPNNGGTLGLRVRAVPEPGSIALVGIGLVGAFGFMRRRALAA